MITPATALLNPRPSTDQISERTLPTIWGLSPMQLHDRYWASRGVQVLRPGDRQPLEDDAELFLLCDAQTLALFKLGKLADTVSWIKPGLIWIRLHDSHDHGYREIAVTDEQNRFVRFRRTYDNQEVHVTRLAFTPDRHIARIWQESTDSINGWKNLRREVLPANRHAQSVDGTAFNHDIDHDVMEFIHELIKFWQRPDATISQLQRIRDNVWVHRDAQVDPETTFVGPTWVGAGRSITHETSVLGPAILWDDPNARPLVEAVAWERLEPIHEETPIGLPRPVRWRKLSGFDRLSKRAFDICFALAVIACTIWIYPIMMFFIWFEDGRPFFFAHRRETLGGKEFPCIKFRSMKNNAEQIKQELMKQNQADGPQFFIENDPRMTRIGKFMRDTQIDELPQFFNVLLGHMSIVGPRPSPRAENQYCPAWREARLSVRPGLTGLWQVKRTRQKGLDFQEWIRYDIEYVEEQSAKLDLSIIWQTIKLVLRMGK